MPQHRFFALPSLVRYLFVVVLLTMLCLAVADNNHSRPYYKDKVAVLVYHHVADEDMGSVTITPGLLDRQLKDMKRRGYHFITMEDFRRFTQGGEVPRNAVLVTFDDGYKSFYTHAVPVLSRNQVQAVNFIVTEFIGHPERSTIPSLSAAEMTELADHNSAELQCHSNALHKQVNPKESYLSGKLENKGKPETDEEYTSRIRQDTLSCSTELKRFRSKADAYAYPYGMFNAKVPGLLQEGGFRYAFTVQPGIVTRKTNWMEIPRINAGSPFMTPKRVHKNIMRKLH
ncbi:polysaccharide deacetylase family protein [Paenibacillus mesotrionivorans]|uniref:Polysaccharide deacetylase family protein n=1 Tax=Paenibacillus mesotrionivorans TaxID=3160968 RepID=A0ACC7NTL0_9BACL